MRTIAIIGALALMALGSSGAVAQTLPDGLHSGATRASFTPGGGGPWCSISQGPSVFERDPTGAVLTSFDELLYAVPSAAAYYRLSGAAKLTFTSATTGNVSFRYPPGYPSDILTFRFSKYAQTIVSSNRTVAVQYVITIRDCTIGFAATYNY